MARRVIMTEKKPRGRPPMEKPPEPQKICVRCGVKKPLSKFYKNKYWRDQSYRDAWCMDCARKYVVNRDTLMEYCAGNNRAFSQKCYEQASIKATYSLSNDSEYVNAKEDKRETMLQAAIAANYLGKMNIGSFYSYQNNMDQNGQFLPVSPEIAIEKPIGDLTEADRQRVYSPEWCGWFERWQIQRLDMLYERYKNEFDLADVSLEDFARKTCKASLNADIAEDRMRRGEITLTEYQNAQKVFDSYSQSSNFAPSKRKQVENNDAGSLGEIVYAVEVTGAINDLMGKVRFPQDDIDSILRHYRHTDVAIGEEDG